MKEPIVSVVIGSYNCEKFIRETVTSVMDQTFTDWELIIVDDCSTDGTRRIINEIKDDRIRLIKLDANSGRPAVPRNVGIRNARGKYIAFLDHDDLWLPGKLEKQVDFLERNKEFFWLYAKCIVQRNGEQLDISPHKPTTGFIFKDLFQRFNLIGFPTVIMRNRKENNRYFFDEDRRMSAVEDYALWLAMAEREKVFCLDEPLAIYRVHSAGLSGGAFSHFRKCRFVLDKFSPRVSRAMRFRAYSNFYANLALVGVLVTLIRIKHTFVVPLIRTIYKNYGK